MSQSTTHPLVAAYLEELDRLLAGIDPGDRAEVMSGVREHLEGAVGALDVVGDDAVRGALAELGPPQAVADEAYAGRPAYAPTPPPRVSAMNRPWVPVVVAVLTALGLFLALMVMGSTAVVTSSSGGDSSGVVVETTELDGSWGLSAAIAAVVAVLPLWIPSAVLLGLSPLWVGREKVVLTLLVPAAVLLMGILPILGWSLVGINGVYVGAWTALGLVVVGGGWLMAQLTRRASARAARAATA